MAVVTGETVQVVCRHCLNGDEVPLVRLQPASGLQVATSDMLAALGQALTTAQELQEMHERASTDLTAAHLIENAFARRWEP